MRDRPFPGASLRETGSREPDPSFTGSGPAGFDPARGATWGKLFNLLTVADWSVADIADAYGLSATRVKRLLKLERG